MIILVGMLPGVHCF